MNKSHDNSWKVLEPYQKAIESIIINRTRKRTFSICIFIFICILHVREKKSKDVVLIYAHKSRGYFLIFPKSFKFLNPRNFLKYKSNVLKYS